MDDGLCPPTASHKGNPQLAHSLQDTTPLTRRRHEMFNKNGNNNGHNGNGTGNGLVQVNGNGHKPDAAIVSEHELLWDGLSPAVSQALGQPLNPALASQRKGRQPGARTAPEPGAGLPAQGARRAQLRLPRRPRRHRAGQPHLRLRRLGLRVGRRRDAAPGRDRRHPDGRGEGLARLQRPGAGHRGRRSAPHRPRRPPGGRGHPGRT